MDKYDFSFRSTCLLSKWGFYDGDQLADFVVDNNYYVLPSEPFHPLSFDKEVLKRIVERYLIPKLPTPARVRIIITHHNSIRVHDDDYDELAKQPETIIELTEQQVHDICKEVKQEWKGNAT